MPLDLPTLKSNVRRQNELLAVLEDCDHYDGNPEQPLRDDFSYTHRFATLKAVRAAAEAELSRLTEGGGNSFAWVKSAAAKVWGAVKASTPSMKTAANWIVGAALTLGVLWGGCLPGPGPNPAPNPIPTPIPNPTPSPAPISADGLRVLFVYESSDAQDPKAVIFSTKVRTWLNENCVKVDRQPEWRQYDQHTTSLEGESKIWQDVMARKRDAGEWLVVSNGKTGYEGKMPTKDPDELIAFLARYKP